MHTIMFKPSLPGSTVVVTKNFKTVRGRDRFMKYLLKGGRYLITAVQEDCDAGTEK